MTTDTDIIELLRKTVSKSSLRQWADANGFSPTFISLVLNGKSKVTPKLAAVFDYERAIGWKRNKKNAAPS